MCLIFLFFLGVVIFILRTEVKSDMIQGKCNLPRHIHHKQLLWNGILQLIHLRQREKKRERTNGEEKMHISIYKISSIKKHQKAKNH